MNLPSLDKTRTLSDVVVVIGAMKCGTSTLHRNLSLHPELSMAKEKELNFFVESQNWKKGLAWYERKLGPALRLRGESSPNYSKQRMFPGVPARMHAVLREPRLIYLVRDPLRRIVSHYIHNLADGRERRTLPEAVRDLESSSYVDVSRYASQVEEFLRYFPRQSLLVVALEDMERDCRCVMRRVFEHLGVDATFSDPAFALPLGTSVGKRRPTPLGLRIRELPYGKTLRRWLGRWIDEPFAVPTLSDTDRSRLAEALRPEAERLRALTGDRYPDWQV